MNVDLAKIMKEITEDILKGAREIMSSDIGINQKVGINTLSGSNLYNQIKWNFQQNDDNILIDLFFNHYIVELTLLYAYFYCSFPVFFYLFQHLQMFH